MKLDKNMTKGSLPTQILRVQQILKKDDLLTRFISSVFAQKL